jgi:glycosyltransferase involved in cell wall biosynthesis
MNLTPSSKNLCHKSTKISVCIPTYNYAKYLSEAIDSVLSQNYANFELLIIDDCSQDNTSEIVMSYAAQDDRIIFKQNSVNVGMAKNWNLCMQEASGEYIKFLFGDDLLCSPDALSRMATILDSDAEIALVASARKIIDANSAPIKELAHFQHETVIEGAKAISMCLWEQKNLIGEPSAVMFKKALATRGFDARYRQLIDLEMWFHLFEQGNFAYLREPLCAFRRHPQQQTAKNSNSPDAMDDTKLLFDNYLGKQYICLSPFKRALVEYGRKYQLWKSFKACKITREQLIDKFAGYNLLHFKLLLLPYNLYRPFYRFNRFLRNAFSARV